jgi:hypothetical protein
MAGPIAGSIEHRLGAGTTAAQENQELFTALYGFLNAKYTRIASNFGTAGTGFDYWDGASPSGENAFAVFRAGSAANPFNILIQWAHTNAFGASPGNPGAINGATGDGVGVVVAFRLDGTNPWAGGVANVGADAKASPVWTPGGSTLVVLDRAASVGGSFATNKENTIIIANAAAGGGGILNRFHVVGDNDGFVCLFDLTNDGSYTMKYFGAYTPRTGFTITHPLVALSTQTIGYPTDGPGITYGSITGTSGDEGGIHGRLSADLVRGFSIQSVAPAFDIAYQPNGQGPVVELDAAEVMLIRRELNQGLCGFVPSAVLANVFNVSNNEVNAAATRAYLAVTTVAARKWSIPWDGGAGPGIGVTRAGRQF